MGLRGVEVEPDPLPAAMTRRNANPVFTRLCRKLSQTLAKAEIRHPQSWTGFEATALGEPIIGSLCRLPGHTNNRSFPDRTNQTD